MSGFKNFIMRGNLVQLAVAVVIGAQFSGLVKQFVSSFIDPLLALAGGTPNFATLSFKVHKATFTYGAFLTDVLSFLIAALVVYFVLVVPVTRLIAFMERNKAATEKAPDRNRHSRRFSTVLPRPSPTRNHSSAAPRAR